MPANSKIEKEWTMWEKLLRHGAPAPASVRDLASTEAVDAFMSGIQDDPAYQADAIVEGVVTPIVATRKSTLVCNIKAAPNTDLKIGDLVECFSEKWIVVELYVDKVGLLTGSMWICNHMIRFQNGSDLIHNRFCVVDDGTYSRRTTDPAVSVLNDTYKVYLSLDRATEKLFVDKRLPFGTMYSKDQTKILSVYKIVGIDGKTKNRGAGSHLLVLTVQRDVFNGATDSVEKCLCDVFTEQTDTYVVLPSGCCTIVGRDSVRIGTTRKYRVAFTTPMGEEDGEAVAQWAIDAPDGVVSAIDGNTVTLSIPLKEDIIGGEITLSVSDTGETYGSCEKKVQVITVG